MPRIRANLATFPPRTSILTQTIESILPQVDRLCVCLNEYTEIPPELADHDKIEASIPESDLKDAGKFAFCPDDDDFVLTIDDDILYPPDYAERLVNAYDTLDPLESVIGVLGHAWVNKGQTGKMGWRNYKITSAAKHYFKVDLLGTGTCCMLGRNLPELDTMRSAAGYIDIRHARLQALAGRQLWIIPRDDNFLKSNMPDDLMESSLFHTINRARDPGMMLEIRQLISERTPHSGVKYEKFLKLQRQKT